MSPLPFEILAALSQTVMAIVATSLLVSIWRSSRRTERKWLPKIIAKDRALIQAYAYIKTVRAHMVFQGAADDDPVRTLVEDLERAIKL